MPTGENLKRLQDDLARLKGDESLVGLLVLLVAHLMSG
jgi:hypothetical protein